MKDYILGLYEKSMPNTFTLEQKLIYGKAAGFDFMEISIDETDEKLARLDWSKDQRKNLVDTMYRIDMPIKTMCLSGHRRYPFGTLQIEGQKRSLEILMKAVDFACDTGIRIIQIAGYDEYYNESNKFTKEQFYITLKNCVNYAAQKGVVLAFETMETDFMNTVTKAMEVVNKINSPYLQVYPDIGNITNAAYLYNSGVYEDILSGSGHIAAAHLKETISGKYREIPFGTGHVDFEGCIRLLRSMGVHIFMAEFWYDPAFTVEQYLKSAYDFITSKIEKPIQLGGIE